MSLEKQGPNLQKQSRSRIACVRQSTAWANGSVPHPFPWLSKYKTACSSPALLVLALSPEISHQTRFSLFLSRSAPSLQLPPVSYVCLYNKPRKFRPLVPIRPCTLTGHRRSSVCLFKLPWPTYSGR